MLDFVLEYMFICVTVLFSASDIVVLFLLRFRHCSSVCFTCLMYVFVDGMFSSAGMHLWRLKYGGFMRDAQVNYCRWLIIVPLTTFHRMAETIGDPKAELILLINVPRTGSTLLTQVTWLGTSVLWISSWCVRWFDFVCAVVKMYAVLSALNLEKKHSVG